MTEEYESEKPVKEFDCVEMKRRGAERIYEEIKDLSISEELAYWQQKEEALLRRNDLRQAS